MTKLEEKLINLGYELYYKSADDTEYYKELTIGTFHIIIDTKTKKIIANYIDKVIIHTRQNIDEVQQAFNVMKQDLEELKQYEESNVK